MARDGGAARVRLRQRREDPHRGRLARPVGPEQPEDVALLDREADPVERARVLPVGLLQTVDHDRIHRASLARVRSRSTQPGRAG